MRPSRQRADATAARHLRVLREESTHKTEESSEDDVYECFGQLLEALRNRAAVTQPRFVNHVLPPFFKASGVEELNVKTYGNLERDERFPRFEELWPLFLGFVDGCDLPFTAAELRQFVSLARRKLKNSPKKDNAIQPDQWERLKSQIAEHVSHAKGEPSAEQKPAPKEVERVETHEQTVLFDTSHVVGRDAFVEEQLSFLEKVPRKKVIIFQAMTGVGKTTVLKLLTNRLRERKGYTILPLYRLKGAADQTPQDHLERVLARLIQDLHAPQNDLSTQPLSKRIEQVNKVLQAQPHPVVLFLDDFQVALSEDGRLSAEWQEWFSAMLEQDHKASLYIATRLWPRWQEREKAFIEETRLEELSPAFGAELFRHLGFADVPNALLRQASQKCGGNANFIELQAASLKRPRFSFDWDEDALEPEEEPHNNTERIKKFLQDPQMCHSLPDRKSVLGKKGVSREQ